MWLSRIEFDLVPLIKLLICIFLVLKAIDLAFPSIFHKAGLGLQRLDLGRSHSKETEKESEKELRAKGG